MINAIVVDDEWYNLQEISDLIEKTGCMEVVKKYQNPHKALIEFEKTSPDIAFIDIDMPEIDGITLAEKLINIKASIIIVFITAWKQYAVDAFDLNAIDYIVKPIRTERFNKMVEKVKERFSNFQDVTICTEILSAREIVVLKFISQGLTQNQVAEKLMVSISTVKRNTESIYKKLNVNNKITAIKKAEALKIF